MRSLLRVRRRASLTVPWDHAAGRIYGELRSRTDLPVDGDRIELYRSLPRDPRAERRERVRKPRLAARRS